MINGILLFFSCLDEQLKWKLMINFDGFFTVQSEILTRMHIKILNKKFGNIRSMKNFFPKIKILIPIRTL